MAYVGGDQVFLFGGMETGGIRDDETWAYDLSANTWTQDANTIRPSARSQHAVAAASVDGSNYLLLFGGNDGVRDDETWTFGGGDFPLYVRDPPEVAVTYPNGGEVVTGSLNITWTATDPDPWAETALLLIDLDYSDDAGTSWSSIATDEANDGSYLWDVSGLADGEQYLVRITATDTTALADCDTSDAVFTVNDPRPSILSVEDVPNDQGRTVALLWQRSYLDDPAYHVITYYSVWREYPYGDAIEDLYDEWDGSALDSLDEPVYRTLPDGSEGGQLEYWEFLGTMPAHFFEEYCYLAATLADSSGSGIPYFTYLVSAHTADPYVFYDSAPDSGYSVDNTTPAKTTVAIRFQGGCAPGTVRLTWDVVTTGVDGTLELIPVDYRVYRSRDPNFQRPPATLVTTTSDLMCRDTDPLIGDPANNLYYYVTAIDGSDNESDPSNAVGEFDWGTGGPGKGKATSEPHKEADR